MPAKEIKEEILAALEEAEAATAALGSAVVPDMLLDLSTTGQTGWSIGLQGVDPNINVAMDIADPNAFTGAQNQDVAPSIDVATGVANPNAYTAGQNVNVYTGSQNALPYADGEGAAAGSDSYVLTSAPKIDSYTDWVSTIVLPTGGGETTYHYADGTPVPEGMPIIPGPDHAYPVA